MEKPAQEKELPLNSLGMAAASPLEWSQLKMTQLLLQQLVNK